MKQPNTADRPILVASQPSRAELEQPQFWSDFSKILDLRSWNTFKTGGSVWLCLKKWWITLMYVRQYVEAEKISVFQNSERPKHKNWASRAWIAWTQAEKTLNFSQLMSRPNSLSFYVLVFQSFRVLKDKFFQLKRSLTLLLEISLNWKDNRYPLFTFITDLCK